MKKRIVAIITVLAVSALVVSTVLAFQMGNVDGVWSQVDPGGVLRVDVIGQIGVDPGSQWGTDPDTDEEVLRRQPDVCIGDSNGFDAFDPADEWDGDAGGTTSGLGSHSVSCGTTSGLIISEYYDSNTINGTDNYTQGARAVEIYNGTGASIDLNNYSIVMYRDGSTVYSEICFLHGTLANGAVHVLTDGDSSLSTFADETCDSLRFTGNDAVELRRGNEPDAEDSQWATGNGDTPTHIESSWWDQTTGYSNTDENQVRYGSPADGSGFANQSGLGFDGVNEIGDIIPGDSPGEPSDPFLLGRLTHYNNPIFRHMDSADQIHYNNLYAVNLGITITGIYCEPTGTVAPLEGTTLTFNYGVILEETPNELTCPYGNSTGTGCDDLVSVSGNPPSTSFTCPPAAGTSYEGIWTVQLLGFTDNGTNTTCPTTYPGSGVVFDFISGERQDSSACLWARIAAFEPTAISLAGFSAEATPGGILVSWQTVSEVDTLGFNLYRAEATDGEQILLNADLIPSQVAPGTLEGAQYSFEDVDVKSGTTYYYWLEEEALDGSTTLYGPVSAEK